MYNVTIDTDRHETCPGIEAVLETVREALEYGSFSVVIEEVY